MISDKERCRPCGVPEGAEKETGMVYRIFVEKKPGLDNEARALLNEARELLGIQGLEKVRLLNRYDAEDISEELFRSAVGTVFSEPQLDTVSEQPDTDGAAALFAVEYLPGQFDQRADSAAQCIQIISRGNRPLIRSARLYLLYGSLSEADVEAVKKYVINPVEAREASLEKPATLQTEYAVPTEVAVLKGFLELSREELERFVADYGLAMDTEDILFCQQYFRQEKREPTITEIRMLDTYWSDHCRHTTFLTQIDGVRFEDPLLEKAWNRYLETRKALGREEKPLCLMDLGTIAAKYLKKQGMLEKLDESEEINACTVKITVTRDGTEEPWLLLFKNETHNHPTEIEPFGGAATCIGGAIRDPLSGRAYVYGAMRVTGAADPTVPVNETIPGKLPQRKIVTTAAAGYASYGNQIGLATGIVDEVYHPGYAAKRMEIGAVIAAAPAANVRRERPAPGDIVILLGGSTGRDGIGGATGSSKAHNAHSVETCGAEVQKGNAPEERKLQRLFRNPAATTLIKRCNDFGAGGVSVAIGELADGLEINLNAVPKKYEGLDGTELAISESQERMAVVVAAADAEAFLALAGQENLQAVPVAVVREEPRLVMHWNGKTIVDISREFLNSNGAPKHIFITPDAPAAAGETACEDTLAGTMRALAGDLNVCSRRGLAERFDSTIGAGTVVMPFGGKHQLTPSQAMIQKISLEKGHTDDCSLMAWGYNPAISERSPYHGAYQAVVESVAKLIASGASFEDVYLTFQEYFEKPGTEGRRWGQPLAALLGAFEAQMNLGVAAIGGKDSMSGSFRYEDAEGNAREINVPPTLVSFAVTTGKTGEVLTPELKEAGHALTLLAPERDENGLPETASLLALFGRVTELARAGKVYACYTPGMGGTGAALLKMALGNGLGVSLAQDMTTAELCRETCGAFILETAEALPEGRYLGQVTDEPAFRLREETVGLRDLLEVYESRLEGVYPTGNPTPAGETSDFLKGVRSWPASVPEQKTEAFCHTAECWAAPAIRTAKPRVLIPAFPGTNCEYDSARAMADAGAEPEILVVRNLTADDIASSVETFAKKIADAQMIFIPGGFSGGDEPDGSAKFITAFFRNEAVREGVHELLEKRDGLMCGICNGFQALIKLGLVPFGKIVDTDEHCPTLTFNAIARHQSRLVRTRIASNLSPWLRDTRPGEVYTVPISHGEGRFLAEESLVRQLAERGQIATQYVDLDGNPTMDVRYNPNASLYAIEGITSPDGRILGKMGHTERSGKWLYRNIPGNKYQPLFEGGMDYFR